MTSTKRLSEFFVLGTKKRTARTTHMCQDENNKIAYAKMNSSSNVNIITVGCLLLYALPLTLVIITPPGKQKTAVIQQANTRSRLQISSLLTILC